MTTKEIEDYINTYRMYPDEYKGRRSRDILHILNSSHRYDPKDNSIIRKEGRINSNGDFEIIGTFKFSMDNPSDKTPIDNLYHTRRFINKVYNNIVTNLGYDESVITEDNDNKDWTVRDMVAEIDRIRSEYVYGGVKSGMKKTDTNRYNRELARLLGFIRKYKYLIDGVPTVAKHNSKYDNMEVNNE